MEGRAPWRFREQLARGGQGEDLIYRHFASEWLIVPVDGEHEGQRSPYHFDAVFISRADPSLRHLVEITTDVKAADTGRAFVETVSVDTRDEPGKYHASIADLVLFWIPEKRRVLIFPRLRLLRLIEGWERDYPTGRAPNRSYRTHGLLVPLHIFARAADRDLHLQRSRPVVACCESPDRRGDYCHNCGHYDGDVPEGA